MNSDKNKIWILAAAAVGLIVLFLVFFGGANVNWRESYIKDKDNAKGTHFIAQILKSQYNKAGFKELDEPIHNSLVANDTLSNYVYIGEEIYLPYEDLSTLLHYVHNGNNAFLFCKNLPSELLARLAEGDTNLFDFYPNNYRQGNGVSNTLTNPNLNLKSDSVYDYYMYGTTDRWWNYLDHFDTDSLNAEVLGTITFYSEYQRDYWMAAPDSTVEDHPDTLISGVNYMRIPYGTGYFYLHTNPIMFTNVHLTERTNFDYINGVFSYLNEGDILWEEHNWVFNRPYSKTYVPYARSYDQGESILKMILENQELKWGWYLLLFMALIFVLFNGKRKQATIPLLPDYANTTLIQIKKVGLLYNDTEDYFEITQDMFENFLWFIHVKLNIDTHQSSEKIIRDIVKQTDYSEEELQKIFTLYQKIENWKSVTHGVFMGLHADIEKFYSSLK